MFRKINNTKIPDDILYNIFKQFLTEKKILDISCVNKEWNDIVNKRLMFIHLKKLIQTTQKRNEELEIDNFIIKQDYQKMSDLYNDLIDTVETFMDINGM